MRTIILLLLSLTYSLTFAQSPNFEDNFSDQDISDWSGDTGDFTFLGENNNILLQQDADGTGTSYLSIPSTNVEGYWEFFVRMDFSPSNSNKVEIYLMSDSEYLESSLNGYKLVGGENGSDDVFRLFRVDGGAEGTEVLTGTTDISSGGDFRVKVTRDASGNWTLEVGEGYSGVLSEDDTGTDNTYSSASHFGFKTIYTSTRSDLFAFDFKIDIPPLEISSIAAVSDSEVDITFNRAIDFSTAQTSNFILTPGNTNPQSVTEQSASVARLNFDTEFTGGTYDVTVSDIEDLANESTIADTSVTFVVFDEYQPGDIIINEFMKDPPSGAEEYVELKNISDRYLNLNGWTIGDDNALTTISNSDVAILPDSFAVISANVEALRNFFGEANYVDASLPALNNGSDQIRLYDQNGNTADSLAYDSDWGGVDVAVERKSQIVSATFRDNWGDSPSTNLGTPGLSNQIQLDSSPPEVLDIIISDAQTLTLSASERLDITSAETISNYTISQNPDPGANPPTIPSITSATLVENNTVELSLDSPLQEYQGDWSLSVENLTDIFGNSTDESIDFNYFLIITAEPGQVAINEFMYDPASGFSEFVELFNQTDSTFDLLNWTLNDNTGNQKSITNSSTVFSGGEYVILAPDSSLADLFPTANIIVMGSRFSTLNNSNDAIVIRNQNGVLIDSLTYSSAWGGEEVSLERRSVNISATFQENWGDSPAESGATPGMENKVPLDETLPEIAQIQVLARDEILLVFSESVVEGPALNPGNYSLNTSSGSVTPPSLESINRLSADSLMLTFDAELPREPRGTTYTLTASNQSDIFGNMAGELTEDFFLIDYASPDSEEVFVTEFMYDPAEGYSEFIELHNPSDSTFNLRGWFYNDNSGNRRVISDTDVSLTPGSYLIITPDSVISNNFPNINFIAIGSRFSALNNTSDNIVIRDGNGTLLDSLSYSSEWGGSEVSLERRNIELSAVFQENWGDSPSENLATPGQANEIPDDETPPVIENLTIINDSTLQVIFSERVQTEPATNKDNYSLSIPLNFDLPLPDLDSIDFLAPDTVILNYENRIPREIDGSYFDLNIEKQTDIFGNIAELLEEQFFLIDLSEPNMGDVVINEFMYDPEGTFTEFVELYNHTDQNFDLSGWTFNDNTGNRRVISDANFEHVTNSYVILAPDSSLISLFPNRKIIVMGSRFSSLNNSTDAIVIRDANGMLIDSLTYTSDWGGNGVSLERLSPTAPSFYQENWANSPSENLATPGNTNEVQADNNPPELIHATATSADSIRITFNERVDSTLAHNLNSYSVSPSINVSEIASYSGNTLYLVLTNQLSDGITYTVTVTDQKDIFGNEMQADEVTFDYIVLAEAEPRDLVINEILYRRASANSEEFIELFNRSDQNFDLSGWTLSDATGSTDIPDGTQIIAGEYLVLTDSQSGTANAYISAKGNQLSTSVYVPGFPSLNDDEDAVVIKNEDGIVIDSLFYNETWGGNQPGKSLERKDPESASNDASNWATSTSETGNSAGVQSSTYQPDETSPEVIFAKLQADGKIFVAFSEFINIDNTNVFVNDEPTAITGFNERDGNIVILGEDAFPAGEPLTVSFSQVSDFRGNTSENLSVEVSQPLAPGNVVINEILYNPLANPDDNLPDQTEYIELYNRSGYAISLEGFFLHDEPDENNEVRDIRPVSSQFKWIAPNDYVIIYSEDEATTFGESRLADYFEMGEVDESSFIRIDRSSLSLANNDDAIFLADSTGTTIDSVFYDENWQNPNLFDTDGIALERIDPNGPSNDPSNWSSSTRVNGGTLAEQNSIFQQAGTTPDNSGITFTPIPFSPDDDGFEDNLFINYKLDQSDYLLRIRIFDRYGREVRKLADGYQAGFEGSLIWDGLTDDGNKNRVGIYIVLFEAYNSANGQNRTFKETVVLARKF